MAKKLQWKKSWLEKQGIRAQAAYRTIKHLDGLREFWSCLRQLDEARAYGEKAGLPATVEYARAETARLMEKYMRRGVDIGTPPEDHIPNPKRQAAGAARGHAGLGTQKRRRTRGERYGGVI